MNQLQHDAFDLSRLIIQEAAESDIQGVLQINRMAFGEEDEADLVSKLMEDESAQPALSLLAFYNNRAIGHILFTKASLEGLEMISTYLLAPMAVLPDFQNLGVGGKLINEGHMVLGEMGVRLVFVLGHPTYYPKHGFIPDAESHGFPPPYPILLENANAWMYQSLSTETFEHLNCKVNCCKALDRPEYWRE